MEGVRTTADGLRTTAEGVRTTADDLRTIAEGVRTTVEGLRTIADGPRTTFHIVNVLMRMSIFGHVKKCSRSSVFLAGLSV